MDLKMSITPESSSKLSPFGGAINKSLLTPCRRVGLSRKRKTPSSLTKLLSDEINTYGSSISEQLSSANTPVIKLTSIKRKSRVVFGSPIEKNSKIGETTKTVNTAKKSLDECFKKENEQLVAEKCEDATKTDNCANKYVKTSPGKEIKCVESKFKKSHKSVITLNKSASNYFDKDKDHQVLEEKENLNGNIKGSLETVHKEKHENINHNHNESDNNYGSEVYAEENVLDLDHFKDISSKQFKTEVLKDAITLESSKENVSVLKLTKLPTNDDMKDDTSSTTSGSSSPLVKKSHRSRVLYDSDDDFKVTENIKSKLKTYERNKLRERNKSSNSVIVDNLKDCKISIQKLSEEDIIVLRGNETINNSMSSDEEDIKVRKKKKCVISDDENDFQDFVSRISVNMEKEAVEKKSKNKISKSEKFTTLKSRSFTTASTFEDEDDAFTSTPDREKNEKLELIDKIKNLERIVNDKKVKLDNLRRASMYKSKHNIEELKNITERWRQGCISGLDGLLSQLQAHGPMDMATLLRNLKISDEVMSKLFTNVT